MIEGSTIESVIFAPQPFADFLIKRTRGRIANEKQFKISWLQHGKNQTRFEEWFTCLTVKPK